MYKILIIEDEKPAAEWLQQLVSKLDPEISILEMIDSVRGAVEWFRQTLLPIWFLWIFSLPCRTELRNF